MSLRYEYEVRVAPMEPSTRWSWEVFRSEVVGSVALASGVAETADDAEGLARAWIVQHKAERARAEERARRPRVFTVPW